MQPFPPTRRLDLQLSRLLEPRSRVGDQGVRSLDLVTSLLLERQADPFALLLRQPGPFTFLLDPPLLFAFLFGGSLFSAASVFRFALVSLLPVTTLLVGRRALARLSRPLDGLGRRGRFCPRRVRCWGVVRQERGHHSGTTGWAASMARIQARIISMDQSPKTPPPYGRGLAMTIWRVQRSRSDTLYFRVLPEPRRTVKTVFPGFFFLLTVTGEVEFSVTCPFFRSMERTRRQPW
jgi:hypothetical protein